MTLAPKAASVDGLLGPMSNLGNAAETTLDTPPAASEAFVQSVEQSALLAGQAQIHHEHAPSSLSVPP